MPLVCASIHIVREPSGALLVSCREVSQTIHPFPGIFHYFRLHPRRDPTALAILLMVVTAKDWWSLSSGFAASAGAGAREKTMPMLLLLLDPEGGAAEGGDGVLM